MTWPSCRLFDRERARKREGEHGLQAAAVRAAFPCGGRRVHRQSCQLPDQQRSQRDRGDVHHRLQATSRLFILCSGRLLQVAHEEVGLLRRQLRDQQCVKGAVGGHDQQRPGELAAPPQPESLSEMLPVGELAIIDEAVHLGLVAEGQLLHLLQYPRSRHVHCRHDASESQAPSREMLERRHSVGQKRVVVIRTREIPLRPADATSAAHVASLSRELCQRPSARIGSRGVETPQNGPLEGSADSMVLPRAKRRRLPAPKPTGRRSLGRKEAKCGRDG
eukprot:scaffold1744_cov252-Pinguiococcus_pyrenoidosus.AAC.21